MPSPARLVALFDHDATTGQLRWRTPRPGRAPAGRLAGTRATQGHLVVRVDGRLLAAHRIVWAIVHGAMPTGVIRHLNGDRTDNRIGNLQAMSRADLNTQTRGRSHTTGSASPAIDAEAGGRITGARHGWLGVTPYEGGRYRARILSHGRPLFLGVFPDKAAADAAYLLAWQEQETKG